MTKRMTMTPETLSFDHPHLAAEVEKLTADGIDALPFGAIRLDAEGNVALYSAGERLLSGYRQEALDRAFFTDVAPCLDTPQYRGRMQAALRNGGLNVDFSELVDLPDGTEAEVRVRMQSASGGGSWIFTQRLT